MRSTISLLLRDMRRAVFSLSFICAAALTAAMAYWMTYTWPAHDVAGRISLTFSSSSSYIILLCVLPTVAYSYSYMADCRAGTVRYWSLRAGTTRYSAGKYTAAVLSGALEYFVATAALSALMTLDLPLYDGVFNGMGGGYEYLLSSADASANQPLLYLLLLITHRSLTAAMFAGIAFCATTIVPNLFVAMMAPVICDTLYLRLCGMVKMPDWLDGAMLVQNVYDMGSPAATILVKLGTTLAITIALGIVSCLLIRRRLLRE